MQRIAIVGAGLGGLVLANGLIDRGYDVTLVTDRSAADVRDGFVLSTQSLWAPAIDIEGQFGLDDWNAEYSGIGGFHVRFGDTKGPDIRAFSASLSAPGQSIDLRVKLPALMVRFEGRGGKIVIRSVGIDDFAALADSHDLVVAAVGRARGPIRQLFPRDDIRSTRERPPRVGGVVYLSGRIPPQAMKHPPFEEWTLIPGVGEFFVIPALSLCGNCHIICVEGCIGGPLDCWEDVAGPEQCLARMLQVVNEWLPWEVERCRAAALIDARAAISGGFTPTVRHAVGRLPSGRRVLAFGDLFVLNDPLVAQGGNTAIRLAKMLIDDIAARDSGPFDEAWMEAYAERAWDYARWTVTLSDMFLTPDANLLRWLDHAATDAAVARSMVLGYENPEEWVRLLSRPAPAHASGATSGLGSFGGNEAVHRKPAREADATYPPAPG
jgi:2-polyprenyl-6-methoxyphenol hydroxylase-like FAD-dependent oxidoreductase